MTLPTILLSTIIIFSLAMLVFIIYDYLMGRIPGRGAWGFGLMFVAIAGLTAIQIIT